MSVEFQKVGEYWKSRVRAIFFVRYRNIERFENQGKVSNSCNSGSCWKFSSLIRHRKWWRSPPLLWRVRKLFKKGRKYPTTDHVFPSLFLDFRNLLSLRTYNIKRLKSSLESKVIIVDPKSWHKLTGKSIIFADVRSFLVWTMTFLSVRKF